MDELKPIFEIIKQHDLQKLKREGLEFNFKDIHPYVTEVFQYVQRLEENPDFWQQLPEKWRREFVEHLNRFFERIHEMAKFNAQEGGDPGQRRQTIAQGVQSEYAWLWEHLFPRLDLFESKQELSAGKIVALVEEAKQALQEIGQQKTKGDELVKDLQGAAATGGISKFAGVFRDQAKYHGDMAKRWLVATAGFTVLGIAFLSWLVSGFTISIKAGQALDVTLQLFFAKILLLSIFSILFYQLAKNYNAQMHQQILNKHRENSLTTFKAFVDSTDDARVKDAILTQATKAIFRAGDTGYVSAKEKIEAGPAILPVLEQRINNNE
ncbi:MAG: hypothetical protein HYZ63_03475 [Candidatus Andersenbacteria bacterium]|nr:hypothetical protein [Candidatus Andersenbacteria bacterium]